jgi:hypothetical protein
MSLPKHPQSGSGRFQALVAVAPTPVPPRRWRGTPLSLGALIPWFE